MLQMARHAKRRPFSRGQDEISPGRSTTNLARPCCYCSSINTTLQRCREVVLPHVCCLSAGIALCFASHRRLIGHDLPPKFLAAIHDRVLHNAVQSYGLQTGTNNHASTASNRAQVAAQGWARVLTMPTRTRPTKV